VDAAEQSRNIRASVFRCPKSRSWSNHKAVLWITARVFDGEILVLHFDADFQLLVRQQNWHAHALSESPFPAAITGILLFEEQIGRPFDAFTEILRQQETKLICIRDFGRSALFLLFFPWRRWWSFFMA